MMKDRLLSRSPAVSGKRPAAGTGLPDLSGRNVLTSHPGANDVRTLSPGVYFVRQQGSRGGRSGPCQTVQGFEDSSVRKIIVAR